MKEHPHAEVLRAIADGVPLSEFEVEYDGSISSMDKLSAHDWMAFVDEDWKVRRKPQHIMVNGFKVPKPLDLMPPIVFWPYITYETFWDSASYGNSEAKRAFERKCAHPTQEAAIAHAKAMLGIDPEYFK